MRAPPCSKGATAPLQHTPAPAARCGHQAMPAQATAVLLPSKLSGALLASAPDASPRDEPE
eukprot:13537379-Alexandrium_andersonii.AAC.1